MSRTNSLLTRLWQGIKKSFGIHERVKMVGEDHIGNRYFEKAPDPVKGRRGARWVEAQDPDQTTVPEVPVEWESWLRRRRHTPPTQEELDRNYVTMVKTQLRAKELEKHNELTDTEISENKSYAKTIIQETSQRKFPKYEEFEIAPGQFAETKKK